VLIVEIRYTFDSQPKTSHYPKNMMGKCFGDFFILHSCYGKVLVMKFSKVDQRRSDPFATPI
jgi:hypothetical protein